MNLEQALRTRLINMPGLEGKVFLLTADEGTTSPYLIISSSEGERIKTLSGYLPTKKVPVEFNLICDTYKEMKEKQRMFMDILFSCQSSNMIGELKIKRLSYESPLEMFEPEIQMYRCFTRIVIVI